MSNLRNMRRLEKKNGNTPSGNPLGGLTDLQGQIGQFLTAAEELKALAKTFDGIQAVVVKIDEARNVAARALEEFAAFEYDLVKQRMVALRMQYHLMWGDYDITQDVTPEERIKVLLDLETQFRAEYDAIQALIFLAYRPSDGTP